MATIRFVEFAIANMRTGGLDANSRNAQTAMGIFTHPHLQMHVMAMVHVPTTMGDAHARCHITVGKHAGQLPCQMRNAKMRVTRICNHFLKVSVLRRAHRVDLVNSKTVLMIAVRRDVLPAIHKMAHVLAQVAHRAQHANSLTVREVIQVAICVAMGVNATAMMANAFARRVTLVKNVTKPRDAVAS
jgi:hypothetical protein